MAVRHHRLRCLDLENLFREKSVDTKAEWISDVRMAAIADWHDKTGAGCVGAKEVWNPAAHIDIAT